MTHLLSTSSREITAELNSSWTCCSFSEADLLRLKKRPTRSDKVVLERMHGIFYGTTPSETLDHCWSPMSKLPIANIYLIDERKIARVESPAGPVVRGMAVMLRGGPDRGIVSSYSRKPPNEAVCAHR